MTKQSRLIRAAKAVFAPMMGGLTLYITWTFLALHINNPVLMPSPNIVLSALVDILADDLILDIAASLKHLGLGMGIGVFLGLGLAFLATSFEPAGLLIDPAVELLRPISGIAWIPLAIMMFGVGETVPIFLIAYVSIFPIYVNTVTGIKGVDARLINAAHVLGARPGLIRRSVILPAALPMILTGFRLSLGVAWMTLIGAELIGGSSGLGWRAFWYEQFFAMNKNLAVILVVGVLGFTFDALIRIAQFRLMRWSPSAAQEAGQ
ncbi:ABC transporter permease [Sulfitobacter mediterraneus]|uniref:ABC transporter permease n=1 Tax=Sulfitobacter mediterraneus TaxID=83219 RepID=UPI0021A7CF5F|nr:ABC transporter permease [Sulfitobacter mediterraneus]UWR13432.1 ABC transporter permease [Sulfitobacter mediterraneus]